MMEEVLLARHLREMRLRLIDDVVTPQAVPFRKPIALVGSLPIGENRSGERRPIRDATVPPDGRSEG